MSHDGEAIVLVHGLWMKPWTFYAFKRYFMAKGYHVYRFGYKTTKQEINKSSDQLAAFVNSRPQETVHLLGHSMGGILSVRAAENIRKKGKIALLASPINGSQVAKKMAKSSWQKRLLHWAIEPLTHGVESVKTNRSCQMVMGNWPIGIGRLVYHFDEPSDGTVAVSETQADWLDKHHVINTNHLGILRNKQAMDLTWQFLSKEQNE